MDGSRGIESIVAEMRRAVPGLSGQRVEEAIERIIAAGFAEDAAAPPAQLTAEEVRRYASNLGYFSWVDVRPRPSPYVHQERLKAASVTVLGLGGTGSAVAASLTAAGVGQLRCVDGDVVEPGNLTRQLLYAQDDIGRPKAEAAAERLRRLNPLVEITGEMAWIGSPDPLDGLMAGCDLFVLCADEPRGTIVSWVNKAALRTGRTWISSSYNGPTLVMGTFVPHETPCYRCLVHHLARERTVHGADGEFLFTPDVVNGVIAPSANLAGQFAALEAIYVLADLAPQTKGRIFHQNLMIYGHTYFVEAPFWPECPECGPGRVSGCGL